jgi:hypothetical protein
MWNNLKWIQWMKNEQKHSLSTITLDFKPLNATFFVLTLLRNGSLVTFSNQIFFS